MLLTGLRLGEVCGLRWSDVDFNRGVLHIRRNRLPAKGFVYEKEYEYGYWSFYTDNAFIFQ